MKKDNSRVYKMAFSSVYPHYITKAEKKNRTKQEVHEIIFWLTGYNQQDLERILNDKTNFEDFFNQIFTICGSNLESKAVKKCIKTVSVPLFWFQKIHR